MRNFVDILARIFLAHIFLLSGFNKLGDGYAGTQGYMESQGVPGELLPVVILLEIVGGLAVIVGVFTRWAALLLAGFTFVAALLFHNALSDQMQLIQFMKNLAITGGLLMLWLHGPADWSLDARRRTAA